MANTESIQLICGTTNDLTDARYKLVVASGVAGSTEVTVAVNNTDEIAGVLEGNAHTANAIQPLWVTTHGMATCIAGANDLTPFGLVMCTTGGRVVDYARGADRNVVGRYVPEPQNGVIVANLEDDEVRVFINIVAHDDAT